MNELYDYASFEKGLDALTLEIINAVDAWEDPYPAMFNVSMADPNTRYKASSAMQKCLRRGFTARAVYYAEAIFNSSVTDYLWNRLPLVVLEDVGLGNWKFCAYVLHFCRYAKVRKVVDQRKALHWMIHHLTEGPKSRALSEAVCLTYFCATRIPNEQTAYVGDCMYALGWKPDRLESPYSPWHQREVEITKSDTYRSVADLAAQFPEDEAYIRYSFHVGTKKNVAHQHAAMPYVLALALTDKLYGLEHPLPELSILNKFPDITYDKHTLEGKSAIRAMVSADAMPVKGLSIRQLGLSIFQAESALVNIERTNTALLDMQTLSSDYELTMVGLPLQRGKDLVAYLKTEEGCKILRQYRDQIF